jgi:hypothetical protein
MIINKFLEAVLMEKRFEVRCPALWAEIDNFEESTYEETITITRGVGYCDSPDSAKRLENFGYTIRDLYLEKEKAYDEKQRASNSGTDSKSTKGKSKNKKRNITKV